MEIQKLLTKLSDSMHVSRSFGPASEHGEVTIVPVAIEVGGGGLGIGTQSADPTNTTEDAVVMGSGGGFGTISFPLGVYVIKNGGVRWVPAIDATRLAVAVIGLAKLVTKLRARTRR